MLLVTVAAAAAYGTAIDRLRDIEYRLEKVREMVSEDADKDDVLYELDEVIYDMRLEIRRAEWPDNR